jgi:hypothetical protein
MVDKCFFTVATKDKYLNFAFTLARSYKFHNNDGEIPFFIISDEDFTLPSDLKSVNKKIISKEQMGTGLHYRFNFNEINPAYQSFFIDADSIIYGNLSHLFNISNTSIRVIGKKETDGNWSHLQLPKALDDFAIPYIIRYCGAFYYLTKNELAAEICHTATELAESDYNFQYHNTSVNDEPIFSISMAKAGVDPYPDTGNIWTDTVQLKSHNDLNTLYKKANFNNSKSFKHKYWLPEGDYHPLVIHFGGSNYNKNPWVFDATRLKLCFKYKLHPVLANLLVISIVKPAYFLGRAIKRLLSNR